MFTNNTSGDDGAAIEFFTDCSTSLEDCDFMDNVAGGHGGAIMLDEGDDITATRWRIYWKHCRLWWSDSCG